MTSEWRALLDEARTTGAEVGRLHRIAEAAHYAVTELCELAEEQPDPYDDLVARLYDIAHKIELAEQQR